jgi:plastocyanin
MNRKKTIALSTSAAAFLIAIIFAVIAITSSITTIGGDVKAASAALANTANNSKNTAVKVHAGGGNATDMLSVFAPQHIQVSVGQSVIWDNPTTVAEPHTVTFVLDNKTMTGIVSPLAVVPNSTRFEAIPPNSNNEPLKGPGPNNVVIAINARNYIPTVIDSQGSARHLPPPTASYTINGNEKYINSGWLIPKGMEKEYPGSSTAFTATFQKAGTYHYICLIHPWMTGSVDVK